MLNKHIKTNHIIFLHLPKNGGSTILFILNRIYKLKKTFNVEWIGKKGNLNEFLDLPQKEKDTFFMIQGHFNYGIHENFSKDSVYFSFLRNPEERLLSFYTYVKRHPTNRLYSKIIENNMSFKDFILLNDKDGNNGQIRKLSGISSDEKAMLKKAIENIENHFPVVGLQEYFDESLIVLAHYFNWSIPFYQKQNVSKKKKEISPEEKEIIAQYNQGDNEFYAFIESRLKKQMQEIPFFKLKLTILKTLNFLINNKVTSAALKTKNIFIPKS